MKIGIVGGALQGMEAVFLSKKAGYETFVLDKKGYAPAMSLADSNEIIDVVKDPEKAKTLLGDCDVVIPACEEMDALVTLDNISKEIGKPFLFDLRSYKISSSKELSNKMMERIGIPTPEPWPKCGFPVIVKPSSQSGSIGVSAVRNGSEMEAALKKVKELNDVPIIQEFVSGKSVSIEVIGNGRTARAFQTTEVILDSNYDCKRVMCEPNAIPEADAEQFAEIGTRMAEDMGLSALMDVEAIYTNKGLRVLEIDARIPSQTPAAVWAATDVNLLEELVCSSMGKISDTKNRNECSAYEHYLVDGENLITCGEKEFGKITEPRFERGFFGADEAITDYDPNKETWRATVISKGRTPTEVLEKRKNIIENIMTICELDEYVDRPPKMM